MGILLGHVSHSMISSLAYQFVDTNILVYAHDQSAGEKQQRAKALLLQLWERGNGCLSIQVFQEFYVTVTRKVAFPLLPDEAAEIIRHLSSWRIHHPTTEDILSAIEWQAQFKTSFWDAMIIQSAVRLECQTIWSEDLNDGQSYAGVQLLNPFKL